MKRSWGVLVFIKGTLRWRHNGRDSVSNHQRLDCLLNRLFRRRSKKTSKLRVTGLCAGNSPGTDEFPEQMASNAENVSIWWRHHVLSLYLGILAPRQMLFIDHAPVRNESKLVIQRFWIKLCSKYCFLHLIHFHWLVVAWWRHLTDIWVNNSFSPVGTKLLPVPMPTYFQVNRWGKIQWNLNILIYKHRFSYKKCIRKYPWQYVDHFVSALICWPRLARSLL